MMSHFSNLQDTARPYCDLAQKHNILQGRMNALPSRISKPTRDLIRRLLKVDPKRRLTIDETLAHPALTGLELIDEDWESQVGYILSFNSFAIVDSTPHHNRRG